MPSLRDEDVRRLDVAVKDACAVSSVQSISYLYRERQRLLRIKWLSGDQGFESRSLQVLHGNEGLAILFAHLIDRADVRMIQRGCSARLTVESAQRLRVGGEPVGKELQGDEAAKRRVLRFIDDPHTTAAKLIHDVVMRDGLADKRGRICHVVAC